MTAQRPYIVLKFATTLDGKIAEASGVQSQITSETERLISHRLRDKLDAIAVGRRTVEVDDPQLNTRAVVPKDGRQPLRVIFDSQLTLPLAKRVFKDDNCLVVHTNLAPSEQVKAFDDHKVPRLSVAHSDRSVDLHEALKALSQRGVTSTLVEGGAGLWTSFLNAGLVDEIWWFRAPMLFGSDGVAALEELSPAAKSWIGSAEHRVFHQSIDRELLTIIKVQKPI
jgi:diaminohydroxyphosphoribosylaminopyrimidine deaminase/5-amino-6-(5-phosphoribosylamino)uracil reductase